MNKNCECCPMSLLIFSSSCVTIETSKYQNLDMKAFNKWLSNALCFRVIAQFTVSFDHPVGYDKKSLLFTVKVRFMSTLRNIKREN